MGQREDATLSFTAGLAGLSGEEKVNFLEVVSSVDDLAVLRESDLTSFLAGDGNKFKRRKIMEIQEYFLRGNDVTSNLTMREIVRSNQQEQKPAADTDMEIRALKAESNLLRLAALKAKSTTERVLAASDDVLFRVFEDADVASFWLTSNADNENNIQLDWTAAPWAEYSVADPTRTESSCILPIFNDEFISEFPSASPYEIVDTHNGWNGLTQDATLFLRNRGRVELTAAAIIELVGQNETGFSSKSHKAKFLRDCMRLYVRCGSEREVHGVITDLSRIVAVKLTGMDEMSLPVVLKTATHSGKDVQKILTAFASASPVELGVQGKQIEIPGVGGTSSRPVPNRTIECGLALGRGLHGKVYSVFGRQDRFVKEFLDGADCAREVKMLQTLESNQITRRGVPSLLELSLDGKSFVASPVGKPSRRWQGRSSCVWKMGCELLDLLEALHACGICHRDVRPSNLVVVVSGGEEYPVLIDWTSAAERGTSVPYVGTVHYASKDVLERLANLEPVIPDPVHDLESLVYTMYDLSRDLIDRPAPLSIEKASFAVESDFLNAVANSWEKEAQKRAHVLPELLQLARASDYTRLKAAFDSKS